MSNSPAALQHDERPSQCLRNACRKPNPHVARQRAPRPHACVSEHVSKRRALASCSPSVPSRTAPSAMPSKRQSSARSASSSAPGCPWKRRSCSSPPGQGTACRSGPSHGRAPRLREAKMTALGRGRGRGRGRGLRAWTRVAGHGRGCERRRARGRREQTSDGAQILARLSRVDAPKPGVAARGFRESGCGPTDAGIM